MFTALAGEETQKVNNSTGETWQYTYDPKGEMIEAQLLQYNPATYGSGDPVLDDVWYRYYPGTK